MDETQKKIAFGLTVVSIIVLIGYIYYDTSKEGMYPMYSYDSNGRIMDTNLNSWSMLTQGYFPNYMTGVGPGGEILGKYDYLQKNISGRNLIPGDLANKSPYYYKGFKDCGCGCNGQKKADDVVDKISKFGAKPFDRSNLCGPTAGTVNGRCAVSGFCSAPSDLLSQTKATVYNSGRSEASRQCNINLPLASNALVQTIYNATAQNELAAAAAQKSMEEIGLAMGSGKLGIVNGPKINEHMDSPPNHIRYGFSKSKPGVYAGLNEVSEFDKRTRQ